MKLSKLLAVMAAGLLGAAAAQAQMTEQKTGPMTIGYVSKSATNTGWILINGGAKEAAAKHGVKLIELAPEGGELSKQLAAVEDLITRKVDAIAIAPVDSAGIAPAVRQALARGIPVVAVDTAVDGVDVTSFVATDNIAAARVQGDWVASQVKDGDKVIYVTGDQSQSTGRERRQGMLEVLKAKRPGVRVLEAQTKWDQTEAQNGVEALLRANPDVKVIATAWDGGALGAIAALKASSFKKGDVKLIGFDGAPDGLMQIKAGWMHGDVAQMLGKMGAVGVETALAAAKKQQVQKRIDTGSFLVTPQNVDQFAKDSGVDRFMK